MLVLATGLILLGGLTALFGQKLFRFILPVAGFVAGVMVGFGGVQAVFGTGAISLTIAILMAIVVGLIMAVLSFAFYEIAVVVLMAMIGASALTYLGIALGLEDNGFILLLMGIAGAVLGIVVTAGSFLSVSLVFAVTAMLGVSMIMAGIFLFAGDVTADQLQDEGIVRSVVGVVDQSFIWFIVWIAGSIMAMNFQTNMVQRELFPEAYEFTESKKRR